MAKQTSTGVNRRGNPDITWRGAYSLDQREAMIREAAYFRSAQRGFAPGHDLEDWLAAEAAIEGGGAEKPEERLELELQQSSVHGAAEDEKLKRIIKQHPRKAIPQVESVEAKDAPFKQ